MAHWSRLHVATVAMVDILTGCVYLQQQHFENGLDEFNRQKDFVACKSNTKVGTTFTLFVSGNVLLENPWYFPSRQMVFVQAMMTFLDK
jgi:hypothetical protein